MKTKLSKYLLSVFSLLLITSCGLKGPLYQTPENPDQDTNNTRQDKEDS